MKNETRETNTTEKMQHSHPIDSVAEKNRLRRPIASVHQTTRISDLFFSLSGSLALRLSRLLFGFIVKCRFCRWQQSVMTSRRMERMRQRTKRTKWSWIFFFRVIIAFIPWICFQLSAKSHLRLPIGQVSGVLFIFCWNLNTFCGCRILRSGSGPSSKHRVHTTMSKLRNYFPRNRRWNVVSIKPTKLICESAVRGNVFASLALHIRVRLPLNCCSLMHAAWAVDWNETYFDLDAEKPTVMSMTMTDYRRPQQRCGCMWTSCTGRTWVIYYYLMFPMVLRSPEFTLCQFFLLLFTDGIVNICARPSTNIHFIHTPAANRDATYAMFTSERNYKLREWMRAYVGRSCPILRCIAFEKLKAISRTH